MGFLTHTESLVERYPRDLFAVTLSYFLGLPAPRCLQNKGARTCEACSQPLDPFGHHRMTCTQTASFNAAHRLLAQAFADMAKQAGVLFTDKNVPCHLTTNKVGDALCQLSADSRQLILDYTVVHPRTGTGGLPLGNGISRPSSFACVTSGTATGTNMQSLASPSHRALRLPTDTSMHTSFCCCTSLQEGGPSSFIRTTNHSSTSSTSSGSTSLRSGLGSARLWRVAWRYGHWEAPSQALAKCSYDTLHRRALQGTRRSPQASTLSLGMHNGVSSLMHDQDTGIHVLLLDSLIRFACLIYLSLVYNNLPFPFVLFF